VFQLCQKHTGMSSFEVVVKIAMKPANWVMNSVPIRIVSSNRKSFDIVIDISVNCSWVDTRWRQYSIHLHANSTQNDTINNFGWKAFWDSNSEWSN